MTPRKKSVRRDSLKPGDRFYYMGILYVALDGYRLMDDDLPALRYDTHTLCWFGTGNLVLPT